MKKTPADPLADARFADLIAELRAQPAPEPPADFTRRVDVYKRQGPYPTSTSCVATGW